MRRLMNHLTRRLPVVHADSAAWHAVGSTLTPDPAKLPEVRMAGEVVEITLFRDLVVVEATFDFVNEGDAVDLAVGFPRFGSPGLFKARDVELHDFRAWIPGGDDLPASNERNENETYPFWKVWTQHFPRGESRLCVRYWNDLMSYQGISRLPFTYVLRTGRFWKGRIGTALVRVRGSAEVPIEAVREATPAGWRIDRERQVLEWCFTDLDPEHDIGLLISPQTIQMSAVGLTGHDIQELLDDRPSPGTPVAVMGMNFGSRNHSLYELNPGRRTSEHFYALAGERGFDGNIVIPEGLRACRRELSQVQVRLLHPVEVGEIELPVVGGSCWLRFLVEGRIATPEQAVGAPEGEIVVIADRIHRCGFRREHSVPPRDWIRRREEFRWVKGEGPYWGVSERYREDHLGGAGGERGRVWAGTW